MLKTARILAIVFLVLYGVSLVGLLMRFNAAEGHAQYVLQLGTTVNAFLLAMVALVSAALFTVDRRGLLTAGMVGASGWLVFSLLCLAFAIQYAGLYRVLFVATALFIYALPGFIWMAALRKKRKQSVSA